VHFSNQDATNALHCQLTPQTPLIARRLHEPTIPGYQRLCQPRAAAVNDVRLAHLLKDAQNWDKLHDFESLSENSVMV